MGLLQRWDWRNQRTMEDHAADDPANEAPHPWVARYYRYQTGKAILIGFVFVIIVFVAVGRAIIENV